MRRIIMSPRRNNRRTHERKRERRRPSAEPAAPSAHLHCRPVPGGGSPQAPHLCRNRRLLRQARISGAGGARRRRHRDRARRRPDAACRLAYALGGVAARRVHRRGDGDGAPLLAGRACAIWEPAQSLPQEQRHHRRAHLRRDLRSRPHGARQVLKERLAKTLEHIVFLERGSIEASVRRPSFEHTWIEHDRVAPGELAALLREATIAIVNKTPVPGNILGQLGRLRLVAVAATGTDNVDVAACRARGIVVSNIRNYAVHTVPEHSFALILALRRSVLAYRDSVRRGRWQEAGQFCFFDHPIRDLAGSTLGIIGEGAIGGSVADLGRAFGMRTLFAAHKGSTGMGPLYTPFDEVLEQSDVITLHCPLTPATRNVIAAAEFAKMKRKPLLINTARGGLVDEGALAAALRSGQIAGAGFDVATVEPPGPDHPLMRLLDLPNFILTPHTAWASAQAIQGLADQLIDNVEAFQAGRPANVVTP